MRAERICRREGIDTGRLKKAARRVSQSHFQLGGLECMLTETKKHKTSDDGIREE